MYDFPDQIATLRRIFDGLDVKECGVFKWTLMQNDRLVKIELIFADDIILDIYTGVFGTVLVKQLTFKIGINTWVSEVIKHIETQFSCTLCHLSKATSLGMCNHCLCIEMNQIKIDSNCGICLNSNSLYSTRLPCTHAFHEACLTNMLNVQDNIILKCPMCRVENIVTGYNCGYVIYPLIMSHIVDGEMHGLDYGSEIDEENENDA